MPWEHVYGTFVGASLTRKFYPSRASRFFNFHYLLSDSCLVFFSADLHTSRLPRQRTLDQCFVCWPVNGNRFECCWTIVIVEWRSQILDDITLANLDIIDNEGKKAGTLFERIDHTSTPFGNCSSTHINLSLSLSLSLSVYVCMCVGKRLLKQWLCSPPCDPLVISARLDAIDDLLKETSLLAEVKEQLRKLPDLERLLRKSVI